jgi:hypothetical protein
MKLIERKHRRSAKKSLVLVAGTVSNRCRTVIVISYVELSFWTDAVGPHTVIRCVFLRPKIRIKYYFEPEDN